MQAGRHPMMPRDKTRSDKAEAAPPQGGGNVYHFTCTARLPWIVETGELRPGCNRIGGYPVDFLWATTNFQGDRTASGMPEYRKGGTALVRLTLHAEDFELWPAILERFPQWTKDHVDGLEAFARRLGETTFGRWRARAEALPLSRVIQIEAKTYTGTWRPVDPHDACLRHGNKPAVRGTLLNGCVYTSVQYIRPGHPTEYDVQRMSLDEWHGTATIAV